MKLIIDIPDDQYEFIKKSDKNTFAEVASKECMLYAIKNGIPYKELGCFNCKYHRQYDYDELVEPCNSCNRYSKWEDMEGDQE